MIVLPTPISAKILPAERAASSGPMFEQREGEADRLRAQIELTTSEDEQDREPHQAEEVEERGAGRDVL